MAEWNFMDYDSKDNLLRTVRDEAATMLALASEPGVGSPDRRRPLAGPRHHRAPRRHHRGLLQELRRRPGEQPRPRSARGAGNGPARRRRRPAVPGHLPGRPHRPASDRHGQDDGHLRRPQRGRMGRADGPPRLHGAAAGLLLPDLPAGGLRPPQLGHPRGPGHQPRPRRRLRRSPGAAQLHPLECHPQLHARHRAVRDRRQGDRPKLAATPSCRSAPRASPSNRPTSRAARRCWSSTPARWSSPATSG